MCFFRCGLSIAILICGQVLKVPKILKLIEDVCFVKVMDAADIAHAYIL